MLPKQFALLVLLTLATTLHSIVTPNVPTNTMPGKCIKPSCSDLAGSKDIQEETPLGYTETNAGANTKVSSSPQQIADSEEPKVDTDLADEDVDPLLDIPTGLFEVTDVDSVDTRKRQNYASLDAGATILDAAPDTKSPTNLLVPDKDRYMLIPCSNPRKWVVISLSEDVYADAIEVANYEKFSSPVKDFIVLGGVNYPTDTWLVLGNFTAAHMNGEQIFQLDAQQHVRYIKFRFLSHYGSEYYCTLSQLRVFGRTFTQVISQLEKSIDAEVEAAFPASQAPALPENTDVSVPGIRNSTELMSQCLMEKNNSVVAAFYDEAQQIEHYRRHAMCCQVDYTPEQLEAEAKASSTSKNEHVLTPSSDLYDSDVSDGVMQMESSTISTNATSTVIASGSGSNTTQPSSGAGLSSAGHNSVPSTQGLGRLESIFVRLTKKIQSLEANQSVMGKQLEDLHAHQWAAIKLLQSTQESMSDQLKEIRSMIVNLKEQVAKEVSANEKYGKLLDDIRRDNVALWNEMLIVREVITTMKAGILCAIALSGVIISFYLLRLLFRCVSKCKERADLREWFWRMEKHGFSVSDTDKSTTLDKMKVGALRVNRKAQFGSSWDDAAIERKTLVSDMVGDGPQKFRRHRTKRSNQTAISRKRLSK